MTVFNAFVGLEESIRDQVNEMLPRQAAVAWPDGNSVWVRFVGEDASAPPTQLPTTVAGVSPGTTGWVYPVAGGKGLFVATAISAQPIVRSNGANQAITVNAAGQYPLTSASIEITGLTPGSVYTVKTDVLIRASGSGGTAAFGYHVTSNGTTVFSSAGDVAVPAETRLYPASYAHPCTVGADGKITVVPAVRWTAGSISVQAGYITVTAYKES